MSKTSEDIRKITFKKNNDFFIRGENGRIKCCLAQETDWLFVFKVMDAKNEHDKIKLCISKVDYYLNAAIIQCACL